MSPIISDRVTLSAVAARAGTSAATVSYVLNETGAVGAETRARVLSAAAALGYKARPRAPRARPEGGGLGSVVFVWVNTSQGWRQSHLAHLLIHTISTSVQAAGGRLRTVFYNEGENAPPPAFDQDDALLIAGTPGPGFFGGLPARLPRLNLLCTPYETDTSFLGIDNLQAGYELTVHLLNQGHRRIGFVSNNRDHRSFGLRYLGFLKAMDEARAPLRPEWVVRQEWPANTRVETAQPVKALDADLNRLLKLKERPTALLAANDWLAAAIYQHAQRRGLRVPDDLSVAGCDDDSSICGLLQPGLTTYAIPYVELGREAVKWLTALTAGNPPHKHPCQFLLRGTLVVRESCIKVTA